MNNRVQLTAKFLAGTIYSSQDRRQTAFKGIPSSRLQSSTNDASDHGEPSRADGYATDEPIIADDAMEFGQLYRSAVIISDQTSLPPALTPDQWDRQPGTRARHLWVDSGVARVLTLDLFQPDWVLLAGSEVWRGAVDHVRKALRVIIRCLVWGVDVRACEDDLASILGVGPDRASLVRPDGHIAWRSQDLPVDPEAVLTAAIATVLAGAE